MLCYRLCFLYFVGDYHADRLVERTQRKPANLDGSPVKRHGSPDYTTRTPQTVPKIFFLFESNPLPRLSSCDRLNVAP